MQKILFLFLIACIFAVQLPLNKSEIDKFRTLVKPGTTPKDIHYAVASLLKLKGEVGQNGIDSAKLCPLLIDSKSNDAKSIYHTTAAIVGLICPNPPAATFETQISNNLAKPLSTKDAFYTARSIYFMRKSFKLLHNDEATIRQLFQGVYSKFDHSSGLFCRDRSSACLEETGYAYSAMSILHQLVNQNYDVLAKVVGKVSSTIAVFRSLDKPALATVSAFVSGLNKLHEVMPLDSKVTSEDLEYIKETILSHRNVVSLDSLYDFLEGFTSLTNSKIHVPIYFSGVKDEGKVAKFTISDLWGNAVDGKIVLKKLYQSGSEDEPIAENVEIPATNQKISYEYNYQSNNFDSGIVKMEFAMVPNKPTESFKEFEFTHTLMFDTSIQIKGFRFEVKQKRTGDLLKLKINHPDTIKQSTKITVDNVLGVVFSVHDAKGKDFSPRQVFLRFVHVESQKEHSFLVRKVHDEYRLEIDVEKAEKELFKSLEGDYDVELVVADEIIKNPIFWHVSTFHFQLSKAWTPILPEISHIFRPTRIPPSGVISSSFTLAVIAVMVIFVISILALGPNLSGCGNMFFNFIFQLLILALLGIICLYWTTLTIFEAFGGLFVVGCATVIVGHFALRK